MKTMRNEKELNNINKDIIPLDTYSDWVYLSDSKKSSKIKFYSKKMLHLGIYR